MLIFDILIYMVGYTVARIFLPMCSFHKMYVQPLNSPERRFNAFGYRYEDDGRIQIESTIAGFLGFLGFLIAIAAIYLLIRTAV